MFLNRQKNSILLHCNNSRVSALCGMQQICNIITICALYPPNHCRIPSKYYQHLPIDIMNYDLPVDFFIMYIQVKCVSSTRTQNLSPNAEVARSKQFSFCLFLVFFGC
jgi:hypothetical protein